VKADSIAQRDPSRRALLERGTGLRGLVTRDPAGIVSSDSGAAGIAMSINRKIKGVPTTGWSRSPSSTRTSTLTTLRDRREPKVYARRDYRVDAVNAMDAPDSRANRGLRSAPAPRFLPDPAV
jgi:hypothetical protein